MLNLLLLLSFLFLYFPFARSASICTNLALNDVRCFLIGVRLWVSTLAYGGICIDVIFFGEPGNLFFIELLSRSLSLSPSSPSGEDLKSLRCSKDLALAAQKIPTWRNSVSSRSAPRMWCSTGPITEADFHAARDHHANRIILPFRLPAGGLEHGTATPTPTTKPFALRCQREIDQARSPPKQESVQCEALVKRATDMERMVGFCLYLLKKTEKGLRYRIVVAGVSLKALCFGRRTILRCADPSLLRLPNELRFAGIPVDWSRVVPPPAANGLAASRAAASFASGRLQFPLEAGDSIIIYGRSGVRLEIVGSVHQSNTSRGVMAMNASVVRCRLISDPAAACYEAGASMPRRRIGTDRLGLPSRKQTDRCIHLLQQLMAAIVACWILGIVLILFCFLGSSTDSPEPSRFDHLHPFVSPLHIAQPRTLAKQMKAAYATSRTDAPEPFSLPLLMAQTAEGCRTAVGRARRSSKRPLLSSRGYIELAKAHGELQRRNRLSLLEAGAGIGGAAPAARWADAPGEAPLDRCGRAVGPARLAFHWGFSVFPQRLGGAPPSLFAPFRSGALPFPRRRPNACRIQVWEDNCCRAVWRLRRGTRFNEPAVTDTLCCCYYFTGFFVGISHSFFFLPTTLNLQLAVHLLALLIEGDTKKTVYNFGALSLSLSLSAIPVLIAASVAARRRSPSRWLKKGRPPSIAFALAEEGPPAVECGEQIVVVERSSECCFFLVVTN
eukprot:gene6332-4559_t